ncbi:WecB/TagA/CpsF family glycosyltransferase [Paenibacillus sp. GCM10027627]|uniref:WecB/TagA/CpsF family glycosyltransferase n=1 Tax=unclassified Paenibacillus TaxID=185978 RepID=UPI0036347820
MTKQLATVPIFGIPFSKLSMDETVGYLTDEIEEGRLTHVITANPIMVMEALNNPKFANVMSKADMIVPDGSGVVWAAKVGGSPLKERVTGFDLMHRLMEQGEKHRWSVYLLGTSQEIIEAAAEKLQLQYPQAKIVGCRNGFFGPGDDEAIIEEIRNKKPHLLFVARGMEKEDWNAEYKERLGVPFIMGVGGSFDVISGKLKRAPIAFQKLKLEWLYRLLQEPSRYKRMLALPKFVVKVLRNKENVTKPRPEAQ